MKPPPYVLVTGANGFLGATLVRKLLERGERVKAFVRPETNLSLLKGLPQDRLLLAVGDIMDMGSYPVIDVEKGGTVQGVINALNWILDVAVVEHMMEGGTLVVPGRGRMADSADVAYYRDMVTIFRDRVRAMAKKGMTLDQIKAARPTRDYDGRWGKNAAWTPNMFVESIHKTLDRPAVDGGAK